MIPDFQQLSAKVSELADLAQSLRLENTVLRGASVVLATENAELARKMEEAYQRLETLLASLPVNIQNTQNTQGEESA